MFSKVGFHVNALGLLSLRTRDQRVLSMKWVDLRIMDGAFVWSMFVKGCQPLSSRGIDGSCRRPFK